MLFFKQIEFFPFFWNLNNRMLYAILLKIFYQVYVDVPVLNFKNHTGKNTGKITFCVHFH